MSPDLLYVIPTERHGKTELIELLQDHPEIRFVSLVGVDLAGNDTDEKIPIENFLQNMESFFNGTAVQTDGSSVILTGIATLNNAKVDMPADASVNWFVDYNWENIDAATGKPIGTLRIPAFLIHNNLRVDSRAVLADVLIYLEAELKALLAKYPKAADFPRAGDSEIEEIVFTVGTELEFWAKTPVTEVELIELSASQILHEQYWSRTRGKVRTALEQAIIALNNYGLRAEMGHKEDGGSKPVLDEDGKLSQVLEQIEVDWRFADARQAADNELQARIIVREVFRAHGLIVTFKAKPIIGVTGNGEHTHLGMAARLKSGKLLNLFAPAEMKTDFLSIIGYGAIMGLLKNYEAINTFVSATNDSFNRLKPGFEAPVCVVTSLGHTPATPSRNRTILAGLIRDVHHPLATRFELRSPNPYSNTYLVVAASYLAMLDGIEAALASGKGAAELLAELSKDAGTPGFYLETDRAYRSEHDIFEDYTPEERDRLFGKPPRTVWENFKNLSKYPAKVAVLKQGGALRQEIIDAFVAAALLRWKTEILNRIIPENLSIVKSAKILHAHETANSLDMAAWDQVNAVRVALAKDTVTQKSIFTRLRSALVNKEYDLASDLQVEMYDKMQELKALYIAYKNNIID